MSGFVKHNICYFLGWQCNNTNWKINPIKNNIVRMEDTFTFHIHNRFRDEKFSFLLSIEHFICGWIFKNTEDDEGLWNFLSGKKKNSDYIKGWNKIPHPLGLQPLKMNAITFLMNNIARSILKSIFRYSSPFYCNNGNKW